MSGNKSILVFGKNGQVGSELSRAVLPRGWAVLGLNRLDADITRSEEVRRPVINSGCAAVVNAAAYTAVDKAESEREQAMAVNGDGPANLADACAEARVPLIHISTDFVFDGRKESAYDETDPVNPIGVYGESKAAGESAVRDRAERHVILRTAWVYSPFGHNFVKSMLRLAREREELDVVDDQTGCPTTAEDIAAAIVVICAQLIDGKTDGFGTFHYCGRGSTTWFGFACAVFEEAAKRGLPTPRLRPIATEDYPLPAARPRNSVLECARLRETYGIATRSWRRSLVTCVNELCGDTAREE